jgi:hypothetical protein
MNLASVTTSLAQGLALVALGAAALAAFKAFGFAVPIRGDVGDWTYVAVACAAARLAR